MTNQTAERTVPLMLPIDETFESKTGAPIDDQDYQVPFAFTGKIDKLTVTVEPPKLTASEEAVGGVSQCAGREPSVLYPLVRPHGPGYLFNV